MNSLPGRVTWDGHVTSIGRKYFWARVKDRSSGDEDNARMPIQLVKYRDMSLFLPGAMFTMTANSKRIVINFTRCRPWTKAEIAAARAAAEKMARAIGLA